MRPDDLAEVREDWDRTDRAEWTDPPPRDRRDESLTESPDEGRTSMLGSYELADERYDLRDEVDRPPALRKESDDPYILYSELVGALHYWALCSARLGLGSTVSDALEVEGRRVRPCRLDATNLALPGWIGGGANLCLTPERRDVVRDGPISPRLGLTNKVGREV